MLKKQRNPPPDTVTTCCRYMHFTENKYTNKNANIQNHAYKHRHKTHNVLSREVKQKGSRMLRAGEERQTQSTHTVYFHLAPGKLSQAQQASGSNFFGHCAFKKGKNDWFRQDFFLVWWSHLMLCCRQGKYMLLFTNLTSVYVREIKIVIGSAYIKTQHLV